MPEVYILDANNFISTFFMENFKPVQKPRTLDVHHPALVIINSWSILRLQANPPQII